MSKKNKESMVPLISTIVVAVLAMAMAVAAILLLTGDKETPPDTSMGGETITDTSFRPTQDFKDECRYAAHDLVADSYRIIRLFVTEGLGHESEPYGNLPEDGLYTVSSSEYTSLEQIENLVRSVYIDSEAQRVLTNADGKGLKVYQNREKLVRVEDTDLGTAESSDASVQYTTEYVLGIKADFVPAENYGKDWSNCSIAVTPVTETECSIVVYFNGVTPDNYTEADKDSILEMSMVKQGTEWRLANFVY